VGVQQRVRERVDRKDLGNVDEPGRDLEDRGEIPEVIAGGTTIPRTTGDQEGDDLA
jgi:hypothetical protein